MLFFFCRALLSCSFSDHFNWLCKNIQDWSVVLGQFCSQISSTKGWLILGQKHETPYPEANSVVSLRPKPSWQLGNQWHLPWTLVEKGNVTYNVWFADIVPSTVMHPCNSWILPKDKKRKKETASPNLPRIHCTTVCLTMLHISLADNKSWCSCWLSTNFSQYVTDRIYKPCNVLFG